VIAPDDEPDELPVLRSGPAHVPDASALDVAAGRCHVHKLRREAFVDQQLETHRTAGRTTRDDAVRRPGCACPSLRGRPRFGCTCRYTRAASIWTGVRNG